LAIAAVAKGGVFRRRVAATWVRRAQTAASYANAATNSLHMGFKRGRFCTIAKYDDTVSVQIIKIPFNADGRNLPVKAIEDEWMQRRLKPLKRWCLFPVWCP
jgi:hypothetical protein